MASSGESSDRAATRSQTADHRPGLAQTAVTVFGVAGGIGALFLAPLWVVLLILAITAAALAVLTRRFTIPLATIAAILIVPVAVLGIRDARHPKPDSEARLRASEARLQRLLQQTEEQVSAMNQAALAYQVAVERSGSSSAKAQAARREAELQLGHTRDTIAEYVNAFRGSRKLAPLQMSSTLEFYAQEHSADMVKRKYFAHVAPDSTVANTISVQRAEHYGFVGENLAWGTGSFVGPRRTLNAWLTSPRHRATIVNPKFKYVGIGITFGTPVTGVRGGATYTLAASGSRPLAAGDPRQAQTAALP